jgi:hypothetical protein
VLGKGLEEGVDGVCKGFCHGCRRLKKSTLGKIILSLQHLIYVVAKYI